MGVSAWREARAGRTDTGGTLREEDPCPSRWWPGGEQSTGHIDLDSVYISPPRPPLRASLLAPWAKNVTWPPASLVNTEKDLQASDGDTGIQQKSVGLQKVRPVLLAPHLRPAQRGPARWTHSRPPGRRPPLTAPACAGRQALRALGPLFSHFLGCSDSCHIPLASSLDADSLGQVVFFLEILTAFLFS